MTQKSKGNSKGNGLEFEVAGSLQITDFELAGSSYTELIICQLSFCLVITCGPLFPPTDGAVHVSPSSCLSSSSYGQTCTFTCQRPGYVLEGTTARVCGNDRQWTGSNNTNCRGKILWLNIIWERFLITSL